MNNERLGRGLILLLPGTSWGAPAWEFGLSERMQMACYATWSSDPGGLALSRSPELLTHTEKRI